MLDQNTFMETIREVSEIIRTSAEPLTKEQILSYFQDMELNEEQQETVFTYLITPHEEPEQQESEKTDDLEPEEEPGDEKTEGKQEASTGTIQPASKTFQMYLGELQGLPTYGKEELDKLYERLLAGEEAVIKTLADAWLKQVLTLARELAISEEDFEDILQEGNMSLFIRLTELCGAGTLERSVEEELTSAVKLAMQSCITELAGEDDSEHAMLGKVNLVNEARKYLAEENGTEPTMAELADYTKMTEEELADILSIVKESSRFAGES